LHGDLPVTSKANRILHGIGLSSIQKTLKKYDGEMILKTTESGDFILSALIPVPAQGSSMA
ncbi:MAG: GHKL domain-containing protein, partial [Clostridia bacterium]|nr:GHKL domain-containing protein [Clostridia bacterium]